MANSLLQPTRYVAAMAERVKQHGRREVEAALGLGKKKGKKEKLEEYAPNRLRVLYTTPTFDEIDNDSSSAAPASFATAQFWLTSVLGQLSQSSSTASSTPIVVQVGYDDEIHVRHETMLSLVADQLFGPALKSPLVRGDSRGTIQAIAVIIALVQDMYSLDAQQAFVEAGAGDAALKHLPCPPDKLAEWLVRNFDPLICCMQDMQANANGYACLFQGLKRVLLPYSNGFACSESTLDWPSIFAMQIACSTWDITEANAAARARRDFVETILGKEAVSWKLARTLQHRSAEKSLVAPFAPEDVNLELLEAFGYPWVSFLPSCIITGSALCNILFASRDEECILAEDKVQYFLKRFPTSDLNIIVRRHSVREQGGSVAAACVDLWQHHLTGSFQDNFPDVELTVQEFENGFTLHPGNGLRTIQISSITSEADGVDLALLAPSIQSEGWIVVLMPEPEEKEPERVELLGMIDGGNGEQIPATQEHFQGIVGSVQKRPKNWKAQQTTEAKKQAEATRYTELASQLASRNASGSQPITNLHKLEDDLTFSKAMMDATMKKSERDIQQRMDREARARREIKYQRRMEQRQFIAFATNGLAAALDEGSFSVHITDSVIAERMLQRGFPLVHTPPYTKYHNGKVAEYTDETEVSSEIWKQRIQQELKSLRGVGKQSRYQARNLAEAIYVFQDAQDDWRGN